MSLRLAAPERSGAGTCAQRYTVAVTRTLLICVALLAACNQREPWYPPADSAAEAVDSDSPDSSDSGVPDTEPPPVTAEPGSSLYHAQQCAQALGPIPPFDCAEATEIPITVDGVQVFEDVASCDNPTAIGGKCDAGQRLGVKEGTYHNGQARPSVRFAYLCRDSGVALIGHNTDTGATCYFASKDHATPTTVLPGYTEDGYEDAWEVPGVLAGDQCALCHTADPFLHSPWIDQVRDPDDSSKPLLPEVAGVDTPYHVVGDAFVKEWELWAFEIEGNSCTSCHRAQCSHMFPNDPAPQFMPPGDPGSQQADRMELARCCNIYAPRQLAKMPTVPKDEVCQPYRIE